MYRTFLFYTVIINLDNFKLKFFYRHKFIYYLELNIFIKKRNSCIFNCLNVKYLNNYFLWLISIKLQKFFVLLMNFASNFFLFLKKTVLETKSKRRPPMMSSSEIISIMILFHLSGFRCFKHFYIFYIQKHMQAEFPKTVYYNRFTELMQSNILPLTMFLKTCCMGNCTGISFVDSTPVRVCKNKRIKNNKVFKDIATVGKSTMGWFYGFKLHLIINEKGEILSFTITQANVDDREPLKNEGFLKGIFGKLFADKGYISKKIADILFVDGVHLITQLKNNMKNSLMTLSDKILLRKRSVIETVNDEL